MEPKDLFSSFGQNPLLLGGLMGLERSIRGDDAGTGMQAGFQAANGQQRVQMLRQQQQREAAQAQQAQAAQAERQKQFAQMTGQPIPGVSPEQMKVLQFLGPEKGGALLSRLIAEAQAKEPGYKDIVVDGRVVRTNKDGASEIYAAPNGGGKPPANYVWDPENPGRAKPIPGGPADIVTGEQAARVGAMSEGLRYLQDVRLIALGGKGPDGKAIEPQLGMGVGSHFDFQFEIGKIGEMRRKMAVGIEGILRAQTGAAATQPEIDRVLAQYLPRPEDTAATRESKLNAYESILKRTISLATKGTTGSQLDEEIANQSTQQTQAEAQPQPQRIMRAQNPSTGQVIVSTDGGRTWQNQ